MGQRHPVLETCDQMLREELPNLFRLYVNPHVTQVCYCLDRYVSTTWCRRCEPSGAGVPLGSRHLLAEKAPGEHQTFIANSFDEALSGAIKLARYTATLAGRPTTGLVLDPTGRLGPFRSAPVAGGRIEFVPGLVVLGTGEGDLRAVEQAEGPFGFVVLVGMGGASLDVYLEAVARVVRRDAALVIICVDRTALAELRRSPTAALRELAPDVVVFDESFVNRDVPFGAFTARKEVYAPWNRPSKTTFHSTTYQPNTISSLHFVRCLEQADPEFHAAAAPELKRIHDDLKCRGDLFRRLYSPSLYKMTHLAGFATPDVRAAGNYIVVEGRRIFDCVGGVACSVRGHNPPAYTEELAGQGSPEDCRAEVAARLRQLTGLDCLLPAVSGAGAVENALKVALVAQYPRRHVLALKSGFGGKTLFALTGTWNSAYKENLDPLYPDVLYVDPFAPDAIAQLEVVLERYPVAVVQLELIQAVGGVRKVPEAVVRFLDAGRQRWGYLLLVDEIQTGVYRTGRFTLSAGLGIAPDLLVFGKGTSDMMFSFALVLYSSAVQDRLDRAGSDLPAQLRGRYGYEFGYRTVLNVLRRGEELRLSERVVESGALFARLLGEELAGCKAVRDVRVYGLLMGIELDTTRWPRRWFRKRLYSLYLYSMLRQRGFPVLVGFCQYEPNVLKITPPLTVTAEEVRQVCATLGEVLHRPFYRLLGSAVGGMIRTKIG
jgi:acetylornithine/succinyldiaminopimelate/putrescine aminotransferase